MIKIVIFDFDGVIVDSTKHNIDFGNQMLKHFGKPKLSKEQEKDAYTITSKQFYKKYLGDISGWRALWYARKLFKKTLNEFKVSIGLKRTLSTLKKKYKLAIVTNRADETLEILDYFGLSKFFDLILTAEHIKQPKPSPQGIKEVLKHFDFKSSEAVYVGDTNFDSQAAKNAHVVSIIVKNKKDGGDYKVNKFSGIVKILKKVDK